MRGILSPFLTDLDARARIKGSRDPLGAQPIWTRFGRHVVGNLTTVTNSLRDFTTVLLGYYFAERVAAELGPGSEVGTFLKWEQLAAYARAFYNNDYAFRGTERVQTALQGSTRVTLSSGQGSQILSDQKTYGLWGLYSVASAVSGLVEQAPPRLSPAGLEFVERFYMPAFRDVGTPNANRLVQFLSRPEYRIDLAKDEHSLCKCVARLLKRRVLEHEREFYRFHLVEGGPGDSTEGRQALLARIMESVISDREADWGPGLLRAFAKEAKGVGSSGESLAHRLERIRACESVLAPAARLYAYLQGFDGKALSVVAKRVKEEWGPSVSAIDLNQVRELRTELATIREDCADRLVGFAEALSQGQYLDALRLLVEQNQATMKIRGGAPWIEERNGRLHVRVRDEQGVIPARDELATLWRFPYFLDSLLLITLELRADKK